MPNALIDEKSPYLLQHAHNPVDWLPWGEEAFRRARAENRLIFLSVGYSTCHWCHVMAHESFENPEIAALLNARFINVKVDREERPDVDLTYLTFVQATTGHGGWPMSVWLTPDLTPVLGGTYFPPADSSGRAGFPTVINRIADAWQNRRQELLDQGANLVERLQAHAARDHDTPSSLPGPDTFASAFSQIAQRFEPHHGGFGDGPKFPRPSLLNLLARLPAYLDPERARHARHMADSTLTGIALGGIHDHLGGGFHRYSVDSYWHVPHFEKMLYDQAQLALAFLEAFQISSLPRYATVARGTLDYVLRDLAHPDGGFFSAEDADSLTATDGHTRAEGAFYVWEEKEIDSLLGDRSDLFKTAYGVKPGGNARRQSDPHGELKNKNTLFEALPLGNLAETFARPKGEVRACLEVCRTTLLAARSNRPRPHRDDKILTAWNGLMISAFAKASRILEAPLYLAAAQNAAAFIRRELVDKDGTLLRSYREGPSTISAFASDYAFLIQGLLDLYEAGFDSAHLRWAAELQDQLDSRFLDQIHGGYFSVSKSETAILSIKEDYDGAEPTPNSIAALNLLRLAKMLGRHSWEEAAKKILSASSDTLTNRPFSAPQLAVALDFALSPVRQIVLTSGDGESDLARILNSHFLPHAVFLKADAAGGQDFLSQHLPALAGMAPIGGKAAVYICQGDTCQLPITSPEDLARALS